ncbi:MAG: sugar-binding protein [Candidatus Latescibacterota bacterium]
MIQLFSAIGVFLLSLSGMAYSADMVYEAMASRTPPVLDGILDEPVWQDAKTDTLAFRWEGGSNPEPPTAEDLSVTFQATWCDSTNRLYVAVQVQDDVIADHFADPLASYYTDDGVEVFLDPDHSGGDHKYSFNAFAYHVSLFGDAIDLGADGKATNLRDHIGLGLGENKKTWEIAFVLYREYSHDGNSENDEILDIAAGDKIGFSIAYNDNDGTPGNRESMVGWVPDGGDSWITADRFGTLRFVPAPETAAIKGSWGGAKKAVLRAQEK